MLTRQECEELVKGPGKFEGEPAWTPYYWDLAMEGGSDDIEYHGETCVELFRIGPEDLGVWPELEGYETLAVWEDEQGFVYSARRK